MAIRPLEVVEPPARPRGRDGLSGDSCAMNHLADLMPQFRPSVEEGHGRRFQASPRVPGRARSAARDGDRAAPGTEALAAARRELPPGGPVPEDYVFAGCGRQRRADRRAPVGAIRAGQDTLWSTASCSRATPVTIAPGQCRRRNGPATARRGRHARRASPSSTNSTAPSSTRDSTSASPSSRRRRWRGVFTFAQERGWRHLRLLSSAGSSYNRDYLAETRGRGAAADAERVPPRRRHHPPLLGVRALYAPTDPGEDRSSRRDPRAALEPVDLTPEGRPDWHEQLSYAADDD